MQAGIKAMLMRGGTSRGLYFAATDLPDDVQQRDALLLAAMGSPDVRQIDGIGGAHPLTSKVALLSPPTRPDADIDYLFLQVAVDSALVSDTQNCGNILAGVGPWAIEQGWVTAAGDSTDVRIHMRNTGGIAVATVCTPSGQVAYDGEARIDGVPGTAAPVLLNFLDVAGGSCGALLPTGNVIDNIDGVDITCIDNGMPVVLLRASDMGVSGYESPLELENDDALKKRVESIRLQAGMLMNLGDVSSKTIPKMTLLAGARDGGVVSTRTFIPHRVHEAIGVLGAVSVATGCVIRGSVADGIADVTDSAHMSIEHPSGEFTVDIDVETSDGSLVVKKSALLRTARKLFNGEVYVPDTVWGKTATASGETL